MQDLRRSLRKPRIVCLFHYSYHLVPRWAPEPQSLEALSPSATLPSGCRADIGKPYEDCCTKYATSHAVGSAYSLRPRYGLLFFVFLCRLFLNSILAFKFLSLAARLSLTSKTWPILPGPSEGSVSIHAYTFRKHTVCKYLPRLPF